MMAEILKTYPSTGALNTEVGSATDEDNRRIFNDLINELRKLGKFYSAIKNIQKAYYNRNVSFSFQLKNMVKQGCFL